MRNGNNYSIKEDPSNDFPKGKKREDKLTATSKRCHPCIKSFANQPKYDEVP